jgi:hypothetical protein
MFAIGSACCRVKSEKIPILHILNIMAWIGVWVPWIYLNVPLYYASAVPSPALIRASTVSGFIVV